jgi:hypothetical protein
MSRLSPERLAGTQLLMGFLERILHMVLPGSSDMAHLDQDELYRVWLAEMADPDNLGLGNVQLLEEHPEPPLSEAAAPRGFIIHNWFGPFLLGPASSFLRGRC